MVTFVKGFASTSAIDLEDHSFEPDAIHWPADTTIDLLYRHDPSHPCGRITVLERRPRAGEPMGLWCEAMVHPSYEDAPFTGFSVRTKIEKYEIHTIPRPHAVVTSAVLLEVSLVPKPCNPDCTIQQREDLPEITTLVEAVNKARRLQQLMATALQKGQIR